MNRQLFMEVAQKYETPAYVFDLDIFIKRIKRIKELLGENIQLCYAMKANPFLISSAVSYVDRFEVCSPGEYAICQRADLHGKRIVLSGVNKEEAEVKRVMREGGAGVYTVESLHQLELLEICAKECSIQVSVILRLTGNNQFGMEKEQIRGIIENRNQYPHLFIKGLQLYTGTQKKKFHKIQQEVIQLAQFMTELKEQYAFEGNELEYGPGFYVPYFQGEDWDLEEQVRSLADTLYALPFDGTWILEIGRFLAATCGYYLTKIADCKRNNGQNFCIVDGGIHHLNYYGQTMAMKIPFHQVITEEDGEEELWTVCGSLCTAGDVLVKNLPIRGAKIGDLLVFERVGAYSVTEGIYLFLSRRLPVILLYSQSEGIRMVRQGYPTDYLNEAANQQETDLPDR